MNPFPSAYARDPLGPDRPDRPGWAPRSRLGPLDLGVALAVLGLGYWALPLLLAGPGKQAMVYGEGKPQARLLLSGETRTLHVAGHRGDMRLEYGSQGVRVAAAACPNQVCVRQGWVKRSGGRILCLPSHVVIAVGGGGDKAGNAGKAGEAGKENSPDGITY